MKSPRTAAYFLLLATTLVWGATFTLVKSALTDISPLLFNLLRFILAALALAVLHRRHLRSLTRKDLGQGALVGLFLALGYQLQVLGLARTEPAKSAFITGLVVIFVPALTLVPAFRPRGTPKPRPTAALAALVAFFGLLLITTPAGVGLHHLLQTVSRGDLLTLACAVAFAAHLLTLGHAAQTLSSGPLATLQIGFAALVMLIMLPLQPAHIAFTPRLFFALAVTSLFSTAAAFTIQSFAQRVLPPTHIVLLLTLEPVFAWLTSLLVLHQGLSPRSLAGASLILLSIVVVEITGATPAEIPA